MVQEIKITVIDGGKSGGASEPKKSSEKKEKKPNPKDSKLYKMLHFSDTVNEKLKKKMTPTNFYALSAGASLAVSTLKQVANYYISDIGRANGDSNYQAIINRKIEVATDIGSVLQGAGSGAAAGSALGPVGALVGGLIGAASSGISLGFKYAERNRAFQHQMFQENIQQNYNLVRANYSVWTGRLR